MTFEDIYFWYGKKEKECTAITEALKKKIYVTGTVRLLLIAGMVVTLIVLKGYSWGIMALAAALFMIPFIILVVYQEKLSARKRYMETLGLLCRNELKALDYDFSAFDGANDRVNVAHRFSFDLDIFGERSLFQSLNRTVTHGGREKLISVFQEPLSLKKEILERQVAVKELSQVPDIRQDFYVTGNIGRGGRNDIDLLKSLADRPVYFSGSVIWNILMWMIPLLWMAVIPLTIYGYINMAFANIFLCISILLCMLRTTKAAGLRSSADKMDKILSVYSKLMKIAESGNFESEYIKDIKNRLTSDGKTASHTVMQLSRLLQDMDKRSNMFVMILDLFTLLDVRIYIRIERWKKENLGYMQGWFDALADFDACLSMAGFAFNHPDYIYPDITDEYFNMSGKGLGHPLLDRKVCVKNDISIEKSPSFMIVTGANMAGKSTYLRTVGVNFMLACTGMPVFADELSLYPASLVTSLRTSDSLPDNESYFYAELKRLKAIIDELRAGGKLFIILDEILKGTNSVDKQKGSLALLKQFVLCKTCGIIATHDLLLGSLQEQYPMYVKNFRFEAEINGDQLTFSYKMLPGIARNMNAYFLMQKMGIALE